MEADFLGVVGDRVEVPRVEEIVAEDLGVEIELGVDAAVDPGLFDLRDVVQQRRYVEKAFYNCPGDAAHSIQCLCYSGWMPDSRRIRL